MLLSSLACGQSTRNCDVVVVVGGHVAIVAGGVVVVAGAGVDGVRMSQNDGYYTCTLADAVVEDLHRLLGSPFHRPAPIHPSTLHGSSSFVVVVVDTFADSPPPFHTSNAAVVAPN